MTDPIDLDSLQRHNDEWGEIPADACAALIRELRVARAVVEATRYMIRALSLSPWDSRTTLNADEAATHFTEVLAAYDKACAVQQKAAAGPRNPEPSSGEKK